MQEKGSSVAVYYGKPIAVRDYYYPNEPKKSIDTIKNKVSSVLKELTTHIENLEQHNLIEKVLVKKGIDFLDPLEANRMIAETENWDIPISLHKQESSFYQKFIRLLFRGNTFLPILLWNTLKDKPKDIVLVPTFRFGLSLALLPVYYLLISGIVGYITNPFWGFVYFISSILLVLLYKNSIHTDNFTTNPS
jgi:hypothetical protein